MTETKPDFLWKIAKYSYLALIVLLVLWEMLLAPLHPGGSWMVLKVIPLLFPLRGILARKIYTLQWSSMFILLYFTEGVVRAFSDLSPVSKILAGFEIILTCLFFYSSINYLRPYKVAAKRALKLQQENPSH